ncbi:hypothetical protein HOS87_gp03 [Pseudomonas phage phiNV3]|uniref:Uncharacterized protein n=1 Tax=Pseudomonas phage phiNV3 TaxID=2079544 RepID=A0A2P0ZLJ5_9CAUD|nr:hypothetical protein HOS87_gp03 [Pseudomonas phage phiNV3]ARB30330.1 hypothetical protein B5P22_24590 [Pseudomonas tolaasii]AVH86114.1 hypothetical protein phiNV3_p03 [Pseudomonas phage phiNV3]
MSRANWQLQRRGAAEVRYTDGDRTYCWCDIVTVSNSNKYGPGTKAQAVASLREMRDAYPDKVYRIVKVSPL